MYYPWVIVQPISWRGKPKRFLFWTWTAYTAKMKNVRTGEVRWLSIPHSELERNCFD